MMNLLSALATCSVNWFTLRPEIGQYINLGVALKCPLPSNLRAFVQARRRYNAPPNDIHGVHRNTDWIQAFDWKILFSAWKGHGATVFLALQKIIWLHLRLMHPQTVTVRSKKNSRSSHIFYCTSTLTMAAPPLIAMVSRAYAILLLPPFRVVWLCACFLHRLCLIRHQNVKWGTNKAKKFCLFYSQHFFVPQAQMVGDRWVTPVIAMVSWVYAIAAPIRAV